MPVASALSFATSSLSRTRNLPPLCSARKSLENSVKTLFRSPSAKVDLLPETVLILLYYAGMNCMRISELLQVRISAYLGEGRWLLRGVKGSRCYIAHMPLLGDFDKIECDRNPELPVFSLPYKRVWEWCRRVGIGFTPENHTSVARTHAHRYSTARLVAKKFNDRAAGDALHHNALRSISYYL